LTVKRSLIGEENAYTLGAFLIAKINQVFMGRQDIPESRRERFYLTIDEFQNFITPSLASLISGARKYGLGLILAHQDLEQLWSRVLFQKGRLKLVVVMSTSSEPNLIFKNKYRLAGANTSRL
jgi:hypothetical protein